MRDAGTSATPGLARRLSRLGLFLILPAFLLSACASSDTSGNAVSTSGDAAGGSGGTQRDALGGVAGAFFGSKNLGPKKPDDFSPDYFTQKSTYCPPVRIRSGTQAFIAYERGHDADPAFIRYQASVGKTARECTATNGGFVVKVGVSGRVVAGPKGAPGSVSVPLRIVVMQERGGVAYSQLFQVQATMGEPDLSGEFTKVVDQIAVSAGPDDRDFIIYVGFDEGEPRRSS